MNPDIIVLLAPFYDGKTAELNQLKELWKTLPINASKQNNIYAVDKLYAGIPSQRVEFFINDFISASPKYAASPIPTHKTAENKITITADAIIFLPLNTLASLFTGFSIITATAYAITNGATKGKTYLKPAITDTVIITIPLIYCNFCLFVQYAFS